MAAPSSSFDGVYEYMYRSLGDRVVRWCGRLDMDALPARHLLRSCFEFLQKVFLGLMYPFSCVLWAIFWSFPFLSFVR